MIPKTHNLVTTSCGSYPIERLVALRHFAAHGQATPKPIYSIDGELLGKLLPLLANGLQRYWINLGCNEDLCNKLALANVIPFRNWPVNKSWILFESDRDGKYHSVEDIFNRFDWS